MKLRPGFLSLALCLLAAPAAFSQSKPILQSKGAFTLGDPPEKILAHRFIEPGNQLVLIGRKTVRILDPATGTFIETRTLEIPDGGEDCERVISPDGRRMLVSGNYSKKKEKVKRPASIWDLQTGKQIAVLDKTSRPICAAFWTDNGKTLSTSSSGSAPFRVYDTPAEISFWDGETFQFRNSLPSNKVNWWYVTDDGSKCFYSTGKVSSVLFVFKDLSLNSASINLWDISKGTIERTITSSEGAGARKLLGTIVSPGEKSLAFLAQRPKSNDAERKVVVWGLSQKELELNYEVKPEPKVVDYPKFSPDGQFFAVDTGQDLQIYDSKTGGKKFELPGVRSLPKYWLQDNRILLFAYDRSMEARETATGKQLYQQDLIYNEVQETVDDRIVDSVVDRTTLALNPTHDLLLAYSNQYVKVFNSLTGELLQTLISPPMDYTKKKPELSDKTLISKATWSRDGNTAYVISEDRQSVSIWRLN